MAKRIKQMGILQKVIFLIIGAFAFLVIFIPQIPTDAETNQQMLDLINWFVNLRDNLATNAGFYAFVLAILGLGYYFLVYKPKGR